MEITLDEQSKTRPGVLYKKDREQGQGGLWGPLTPWPLSSSAQPFPTPRGPDDLAFMPKLCRLPAAAEQDLHREGESSPPSSPKPWMEKLRSLLQAGGLCTGCLSQPFSHLHSCSSSSWETVAKPFPCLTPSSWHSTHPAIEWGSKPPPRVLLTLGGGKSIIILFLPLIF